MGWARLLLLVASGAVVLATEPATDVDELPDKYYVVVDAGSTGSRVFVYAQSRKTNEVSIARQPKDGSQAIFSVVPGLSSYAETPSAAYDDTFHDLLKFAATVIPADQVSQTPLYVRGTAGLRRISKAHRLKIFDELLSRTQNDYDFIVYGHTADLPTFDIMAGDMEGIYAWLAINHKEKALGRGPGETFGAADIGGSSSQLVFAVDLDPGTAGGEVLRGNAQAAAREAAANAAAAAEAAKKSGDLKSIMGFSLFSHSFPRTGMSAMWDDYLEQVVAGANGQGDKVDSPCLHPGQTVTYDCGLREGDYTCAQERHAGERKSLVAQNTRAVTLYGTGNFEECKRALEKQVLSHHPCP